MRKRYLLYLIIILLYAGLLSPGHANAAVTTHTEAYMSNVQITPSAGSINWLTNWEIDSAASGFDSYSGSDNDYDEDLDLDGETSASTITDKTSTSTSASSNSMTLDAITDTDLPDSTGSFVSTFAGSTMYREFEVTGGTGNVDVTFSYDFTAQLMGSAAGYGSFSIDYITILEISDGNNTWDITSTNRISGSDTSLTQNYGDTLSDTVTLQYNTPYYIILNVDPEDGTGEDDETDYVELHYFTATGYDEFVFIEWETATEIDNAGFNIWGSEEVSGEYFKINAFLIPSKGDGAYYSFTDYDVIGGNTYYYKLEDIDLYGVSTFHGPASATVPYEGIILISPQGEAVLPSWPPATFEWNSSEGFDRFKLQFSKRSDFNRKVITLPKKRKKWITDNFYTPEKKEWKKIKRLRRESRTIYWRVYGKNESSSYTSEASSFTIQGEQRKRETQ